MPCWQEATPLSSGYSHSNPNHKDHTRAQNDSNRPVLHGVLVQLVWSLTGPKNKGVKASWRSINWKFAAMKTFPAALWHLHPHLWEEKKCRISLQKSKTLKSCAHCQEANNIRSSFWKFFYYFPLFAVRSRRFLKETVIKANLWWADFWHQQHAPLFTDLSVKDLYVINQSIELANNMTYMREAQHRVSVFLSQSISQYDLTDSGMSLLGYKWNLLHKLLLFLQKNLFELNLRMFWDWQSFLNPPLVPPPPPKHQ